VNSAAETISDGNLLHSGPAPAGLVAEVSRSRVRLAVGALAIVALLFAVYRPILPGSFLMDDHRLIGSDNPLVNGQFTPRSIWFQTDFTLTTFGWWLQRLAWGENPAGYHVVDLLLQAAGAILLWRLLARLKIPGAWLAAAIFAIHPVGVNSVARIAEQKNTLSLPFFLLSFWSYLYYEAAVLHPPAGGQAGNPSSRGRATVWYAVSLTAFVLSLLSKTTTVMLPVLLLGCAAWQRGKITRRDVLHTGPFFLLALAFGLMSIWFQTHQALFSAGETLPPESFGERLAVAGHMFWFYLGKAVLPLNLNLIYPRWKLDAGTVAAYWLLVALVAAGLVCWRFRRTWGRHGLFGVGCFGVMLFPALGFFDTQFLTTWQVSDHLQYLPLIAPVALLAAGLAWFLKGRTFQCAAAVLLLALAALSFRRAEVFATDESLLRDTLAKNPAAYEAHNDLGVILAKENNFSGATEQFALAVQENPDYAAAHSNLGHALMLQGRLAEAEAHFRATLKSKPGELETHRMLAGILEREGRNREAIFHLRSVILFQPKSTPEIETRMELASLFNQTGDYRQATEQLRQAVQLKPGQPEPLNNLAWLLATCADDSVRDGAEAVRCAELACQLTAFKQARATGTLAAAYAEAGRFPEAVATSETAVKLASADGDQRLTDISNQLLNLYRAGKPYHEQPVGETRL
jgi:Flp pilus assembly protein TadD